MQGFKKLERETGIEPATSTLARSHSTAELLPLGNCVDYNKPRPISVALKRNDSPDYWPKPEVKSLDSEYDFFLL